MDPIDNHYVNNWSAVSSNVEEKVEPAMGLQDPEGDYYPQDTASPSSTTSTITGTVTSRTITTLEESDMNPTPERAHPIAIFTAVLFQPKIYSRINSNSNNYTGVDDCQDTVTSALSSDDDCDEQDVIFDRDHDLAVTAAVLRLARFQRYTMVVGLIVGFFIQFSSLGANFLLSTAVGTSTTAATSKAIIWFSLGWSLFTSILGVSILLLLRFIVTTAWNMTSSSATSIPNDSATMIDKMESHFAIGALVGVCLAWTCTDVVLGMMAHVVQSVVTLVAALMWCRLISYTDSFCSTLTLNPSSTEDAGMAEPLLPATTEPQPENDFMNPTTIMSCKRIFQRYSLVLGTVVGFFIQFSSLGANFLFTALYGTALEQHQYDTVAAAENMDSTSTSHAAAMTLSMHPNVIVYFSMGWSFLTSCMGVLILVLLRNLVLLSWSNLDQEQEQHEHQDQQQQRSTRGVNASASDLLNHLLWCMESFFATGALLGVNVAWIVTDTLLGLQVHWMHSILALGVALFWCKSVAFVLGLFFPVAAQAQVSKDQDTSSLLIV